MKNKKILISSSLGIGFGLTTIGLVPTLISCSNEQQPQLSTVYRIWDDVAPEHWDEATGTLTIPSYIKTFEMGSWKSDFFRTICNKIKTIVLPISLEYIHFGTYSTPNLSTFLVENNNGKPDTDYTKLTNLIKVSLTRNKDTSLINVPIFDAKILNYSICPTNYKSIDSPSKNYFFHSCKKLESLSFDAITEEICPPEKNSFNTITLPDNLPSFKKLFLGIHPILGGNISIPNSVQELDFRSNFFNSNKKIVFSKGSELQKLYYNSNSIVDLRNCSKLSYDNFITDEGNFNIAYFIPPEGRTDWPPSNVQPPQLLK